MTEPPLYYEAHVTIEPVFNERLEAFVKICRVHRFSVADLLFKKREEDTPVRSQYDTFCTGRSPHREPLESRMAALVRELQLADFKVWRYKVEATLSDSKFSDSLGLLS